MKVKFWLAAALAAAAASGLSPARAADKPADAGKAGGPPQSIILNERNFEILDGACPACPAAPCVGPTAAIPCPQAACTWACEQATACCPKADRKTAYKGCCGKECCGGACGPTCGCTCKGKCCGKECCCGACGSACGCTCKGKCCGTKADSPHPLVVVIPCVVPPAPMPQAVMPPPPPGAVFGPPMMPPASAPCPTVGTPMPPMPGACPPYGPCCPPEMADRTEYKLELKVNGGSRTEMHLCNGQPVSVVVDGPMGLGDADPACRSSRQKGQEHREMRSVVQAHVVKLTPDRVRLLLDVEQCETGDYGPDTGLALGSSLHAIQLVTVGKTQKLELQRAADGSTSRWLEVRLTKCPGQAESVRGCPAPTGIGGSASAECLPMPAPCPPYSCGSRIDPNPYAPAWGCPPGSVLPAPCIPYSCGSHIYPYAPAWGCPPGSVCMPCPAPPTPPLGPPCAGSYGSYDSGCGTTAPCCTTPRPASPSCPTAVETDNLAPWLGMLGLAADLCCPCSCPGILSVGTSLVEIASGLMSATWETTPGQMTLPSGQYFQHPPQYVPPSPPFPQAEETCRPPTPAPAPKLEPAPVSPREDYSISKRRIIRCGGTEESVPPADRGMIAVAAQKCGELEMSVGGEPCLTCKKMVIQTAETPLSLSTASGQVRVRTSDLRARADCVRTDRKGKVILDGSAVLYSCKDGNCTTVKGEHIELNLADGSVKVDGSGAVKAPAGDLP